MEGKTQPEPWEDWEECNGECEACGFEDCREWSEENELRFSKLMKEVAILRLSRQIEEIDRKLKQLGN